MRQDAFEQLSRDNADIPRHDVLASTQKLLDRVLFVAFCEDRGLLPAETIRKAYEHRDPYHPRPIWENFRGLFSSINKGNAALGIHAYNGGLFADDPLLDSLKVSDEVCGYFRDLASYDYQPAYRGDRRRPSSSTSTFSATSSSSRSPTWNGCATSWTDWPSRWAPRSTRPAARRKATFYTPSFITRYIVDQALAACCATASSNCGPHSRKAAKGGGEDRACRSARLSARQADQARRRPRWSSSGKPGRTSWPRSALLDPACGSGAFLIEAFDQLHATYQRSNDRLAELRGHRTPVRPGQADSRKQSLRRGPERRGHRDLPAEPVDQDGRARQGADEPRPSDPRRQQRRRRSGRSSQERSTGKPPSPKSSSKAASTSSSAIRPTSARNG